MTKVKFNTIDAGDLINRINTAIDDAAADIVERDDVMAKRVITIKLALNPKDQYVGIEHQIIKSWPPENPAQSVAFLSGKILVDQIKQENIFDAMKAKQEAKANGNNA